MPASPFIRFSLSKSQLGVIARLDLAIQYSSDVSVQAQPSLEYWMPRSSRGMTAEEAQFCILARQQCPRDASISRPSKEEGAGSSGCSSHPQPCVQVKKARKQVTTGAPPRWFRTPGDTFASIASRSNVCGDCPNAPPDWNRDARIKP
jgi:hypothetical protein